MMVKIALQISKSRIKSQKSRHYSEKGKGIGDKKQQGENNNYIPDNNNVFEAVKIAGGKLGSKYVSYLRRGRNKEEGCVLKSVLSDGHDYERADSEDDATEGPNHKPSDAAFASFGRDSWNRHSENPTKKQKFSLTSSTHRELDGVVTHDCKLGYKVGKALVVMQHPSDFKVTARLEVDSRADT